MKKSEIVLLLCLLNRIETITGRCIGVSAVIQTVTLQLALCCIITFETSGTNVEQESGSIGIKLAFAMTEWLLCLLNG